MYSFASALTILLVASVSNAQTTCTSGSLCSQADVSGICKTAYQRYEDTGLYDTAMARIASADGIDCTAQFTCDSSQKYMSMSGKDMKIAFNTITAKGCGCGSSILSQSNCLVRLLVSKSGSGAADKGFPYSHIPITTTSTSTSTSTSTTTTSTSTSTSTSTTTTSTSTSTTTTGPITTTTSTTTSGSPPGGGTTTTAPPAVQSAEDDQAHQDVSSAGDAVSSYSAAPTSSPLAQAAKDSIGKSIDSGNKALKDTSDQDIRNSQETLMDKLDEAFEKARKALLLLSAAGATDLTIDMTAAIAADEAVQQMRKKKNQSTTTTQTTTTTSSSSSSTSGCTGSPVTDVPPEPAPTDDSGESGDDGDSSDFTAMSDFANSSLVSNSAQVRGFNVCGNTLTAPAYDSWHGPTSTTPNTYTPWFSYRYTWLPCGTWTWSMVKTPGVIDNRAYATEHVYELQLTNIFLNWLGTQDEALAHIQSQPVPPPPNAGDPPLTDAQRWCGFTITPFLTNNPAWAPANVYPGAATPALRLQSLMTGGSPPVDRSEFMYVEKEMNQRKENLFSGKNVGVQTSAQNALGKLADMMNVVKYLRDSTARINFKIVSNRVHQFYQDLDTICAQPATAGQGPCAVGFNSWADKYDLWQLTYLNARQAQWFANRDTLVARARALLPAPGPNQLTVAAQKIFNDRLDAAILPGDVLSDEALSWSDGFEI